MNAKRTTAVPVPYDNPHFVMQLSSKQFAYSFWQKCQVTSPGAIQSLRTAKVEALFLGLLSPHDFMGAQQDMRSLYTPEEHIIYQDNFTPLTSLDTSTLTPRWPRLFNAPTYISGDNYPDGVNSMNFHASARLCVVFNSWGKWMNLQEIIQGGGRVAQLAGRFHKQVHLLSFQLEVDKLWNVLQGEQGRFWNRQFI